MEPNDAYVLSLTLGIAFGVVYGLASFITYRLALRKSARTFMMVAFGGMAIRLMMAATAVVLVLALAPVQPLPFVTSFFAVFAMALVLEVTVLHRQQTRQAVART
ncbi:MAG: hypothetical protein JJ896_01665 [Rhodothermales bacterium]|nr:hypothetical protein [Rhodothermales bacterium]MBO6778335.1 hypothetical protein [Rhodothermales bacterium]